MRIPNAAKPFPEPSGINWPRVEYGEKVVGVGSGNLVEYFKIRTPQHLVSKDLEIDS
jgi:hypothetical protein